MKPVKTFLGLLFLLCLCLGSAQEAHNISILVDTKNASPEKALQWSASENTKVLDSGEQGPFTFFAQVGDQVRWDAISLTEPDVPIVITSLQYVTGPRIFSKNEIKGIADTQATVIRGGKDYYVYILKFRIGKAGKEHQITSRIRVGD